MGPLNPIYALAMVNREHAQDWPVRAAHALSGWAAGATCGWAAGATSGAGCSAGCANNPEFLEDPVIGVKYKTSSSAMGLLLGVALLGVRTPPLGLCSANGFWRGMMACRVRACPCAYP